MLTLTTRSGGGGAGAKGIDEEGGDEEDVAAAASTGSRGGVSVRSLDSQPTSRASSARAVCCVDRWIISGFTS